MHTGLPTVHSVKLLYDQLQLANMSQKVCGCVLCLSGVVSMPRQPELLAGVWHIADGGSRTACQEGAQIK